MAVYLVKTEKVIKSPLEGIRWHLDSPCNDDSIEGDELSRKGLMFQGWLLNETELSVSLVVLSGDDVIPVAVNRPRPDVITRLLKKDPEIHPLCCCGFSEKIKLKQAKFSVGIVADGIFTELFVGSINGKFKILEGKNNWLFLDNDSNKSVEQHTGKLKLSRSAKAGWKKYLSSMSNFSSSSNIPVCLLVAPSKEQVYSTYYPHKFSKNAPICSLLAMIPKDLNFIFPLNELKNSEKRSFRVCDTHWTLHGARLASQLVASKLSTNSLDYFDVFGRDEYRGRKSCGDLGSKLYPTQKHSEDNLINYSYRKSVVFDNKVENFGRVIVTRNDEAVMDKTLLLFGSSSSYTMLHFMCRLYSTLVFVHTAGNVDHQVVGEVKPDCICLQTNARFVVKAPSFNDSVENYITQKKNNGKLEAPLIVGSTNKDSMHIINYFLEMLKD